VVLGIAYKVSKEVEMESLPWFWIWLVLAAALCIGEMFTLSFFLLPFAIGAAVSAIAHILGADLLVQWILFVAVSVLALIALRPVVKRITKNVDGRTGAERLIGSVGEVIEGDAPQGLVRIRVEREEWNASVEDGSQLAIGTPVVVHKIDGTRLIVSERKGF
jgi:membrane protein implicated in regulation of membrane protease activity